MSNEDELSKAFDEEYIKHCALFPKREYERGVIDGRQMQMQSSVDKAVNAMTQPTYYIPSKDQPTRNEVLEEVAKEIERFTAFGPDTIASFAVYIRSMKK